MNKSIFITLILACNLAFANSLYQSKIEYLWNKFSYERQIDTPEGFLPLSVTELLETKAEEMEAGERLLLAFYPTGSGFDYLSDGSFTDMEEFFPYVRELGFKIHFCCPQKHIAEFKDENELKSFSKDVLSVEITREEAPLCFPTKLVIAELIKK